MTEPVDQGNALVDLHAKGVETELQRLWHNWGKSILPLQKNKMTPHYQIFVTGQQSPLESEKLRWESNGCKVNRQGYGKPKKAILLVAAPWQS